MEPDGDRQAAQAPGRFAATVARLGVDHRPAAGGRIVPALEAPESGERGHKKAPRREAGGLFSVDAERLGALVSAAAVRRGAALALGRSGFKALEVRTGPIALRTRVGLVHRYFSLP